MRRIIFCLVLILMAALPAAMAADPRDYVYPAFENTWPLKGKPVLFDKSNLYEHINGEAEIFFPYGFESLSSRTYVNSFDPDAWIVADVYRMGSPLDAFGIYSNFRSPESEFVKTGTEGFISPAQVVFYQDRYFVRIQVTGAAELDRKTLLQFAHAESVKLPANLKAPQELQIIDVPGIAPKSERYIARSLLGYNFLGRGITADVLAGKESSQVFVVFAASPDEAIEAMEKYAAYLKSEGKGAAIARMPGRAVLESDEPLFGRVYVEQSGKYLLGAVKFQDVPSAKAMVERMRAKLEGGK